MKSIKELKNPDVIEINGEKFQVVNNTGSWYHRETGKLEMVLELVKAGEEKLTPAYQLRYHGDDQKTMKFFCHDPVSGEWKHARLKSLST